MACHALVKMMDGPRYLVFDNSPEMRGLNCSADELAEALRVPLAVVGVRVIRQRGATTNSSFSEFQARGLARKKYEAKAAQVKQTVDKMISAYQSVTDNRNPEKALFSK